MTRAAIVGVAVFSCSLGMACEKPREWLPNPPGPGTLALAASREVARGKFEPQAPKVHGVGIFDDLNDRVRVRLPSWLPEGTWRVLAVPGGSRLVFVGDRAVGFATDDLGAASPLETLVGQDHDADGIPDGLDVLLGAKKVVLDAAPYRETYRVIPYPWGDVPRTEGVCTDVVIRALRNAGFDLQALVHEDARQHPAAYPSISKLDRNIDHRRVRNLRVFFQRHWLSLPADPADRSAPWLPGDVVFFDTMKDPAPDHLGIVSDTLGDSGNPLVVNSWTNGYVSSEMDLLGAVRTTHRFRSPLQQPPRNRRP